MRHKQNRHHFISGMMVVVLFLFCVGSAQAAQFSGEYLLQVCSSTDKGKETSPGAHGVCQSYIAGVLDYHSLIRSLGTSPSVDFCVPESTSLYDLQDVVVRYIARNLEEHGKFIASPAVALALFEKYPCKK